MQSLAQHEMGANYILSSETISVPYRNSPISKLAKASLSGVKRMNSDFHSLSCL